ncbi:hypothetical protein SPRG_02604 [Saprolegnia parasitica CBS 223.65]|uniref:Uncharacterized protein n=1 Tax=Saprolegnia parasitica (strain CBS 223.65) TaxID=695850 RepID=A0A067D1K2_SAPPC|nr:hypothetical protein SPRG_02604 [Saprolegnia parasitica CBS 223.65]KDO32912.1 hypothetical protein SPRG_02604 [Saprolegnia parasitica CBS 223.65]|eukprot:XP_012196560.1 hypothetical protein SPRG_02604 [Saprolegnia parasitica CBS 223.65]
MTTFLDAVLRQPELAALVFGYQGGVFEDIAPRFLHFYLFVDFESSGNSGVYWLDPVLFRTSYRHRACDETPPAVLSSEELNLNQHNTRDPRFPLHLAILEGDLTATRRILRCRPDLAYQEAIALAIQHHHLEIAAYLLEQRATNMPQLYRNFEDTYGGWPSRCLDEWLPRSTLCMNDSSVVALLWAHRQRDWNWRDLVLAAIHEHALEALAFLCRHAPPVTLTGVLDAVSGYSPLSLVEALHARGVDCTHVAMDRAASAGNLDVVVFLHTHRNEGCTTDAMNIAATYGYLDIVVFLHENRREGCTRDALDGAVAGGYLDIVQFLVDHRDEGASSDVLDIAAASGHLDMFVYWQQRGSFACTTAAMDLAASNGHLDVVAYLLAHRDEYGGSPDGAVRGALANGHIAIVELLIAAGYSLPTDIPRVVRAMRQPNALALLQLYVAQGIALPAAWTTDVHTFGAKDVVAFYRQHSPHHAPNGPSFPFKHMTLDDVQTALAKEDFKAVGALWATRPELRHDCLLEVVVRTNESLNALTFLLEAGVGQPRDVARAYIRRRSFDMLRILLPHCLDATDPIDNLVFLVEWVHKQSHDFTASPLRLLKTEMVAQAHAANCLDIHAGTGIEALTAMLLQTGATTAMLEPAIGGLEQRVLFKSGVTDWGLATLFVHVASADPTKHVAQLLRWLDMVTNAALTTHLQHLLQKTFADRLDVVAAALAASQALKYATALDDY